MISMCIRCRAQLTMVCMLHAVPEPACGRHRAAAERLHRCQAGDQLEQHNVRRHHARVSLPRSSCVRSAAPWPGPTIQKDTRVLIPLWDSLMFGRVPENGAAFLGTRPNISESHSETSTRVPFCIVGPAGSLACSPLFAARSFMAAVCGPHAESGSCKLSVIQQLSTMPSWLYVDGYCPNGNVSCLPANPWATTEPFDAYKVLRLFPPWALVSHAQGSSGRR